MALLIALAVIAAVLLIAGVAALIFSGHVGKAGKPLWLIGGLVLALGGLFLAVWVGLMAAGYIPAVGT